VTSGVDGDDGTSSDAVDGEEEPPSPEEVRRLRAERDTLRHELELATTPRKRRLRRSIVGVLVALSCLLVVLSVTVVWAHRTVLNTDVFVGTVSPILHDGSVDQAIANRSTNQLYVALDVKHRIEEALPHRVAFVAGPIAQASQQVVSSQISKVIGSDRFQQFWTQMLTTTHEQVVAVLRGHNTVLLSTSHGYIVLNTVPLINKALGQVSGLASSLTGHHVTLPTITSAELPQQAIDKLSHALGVTLPSDFGQVTLVKSDQLSLAQRGVNAFDRLTILLPILTLVLIVLALWLSIGRRRTLLQLAVGVALLTILVRRLVIYEQGALSKKAEDPQVAHHVLGELLHGLYVSTAWILWVSLAVVVISLVTGPYRWATSGRSYVRRGWDAVAWHLHGEGGRATLDWIAAHAAVLQFAVAVVAAIVLWLVSVSWLSFLLVGALVAVVEIYLANVKSPPGGRSAGDTDRAAGISPSEHQPST
jgi:hypothetical protein